MIRPEQIPPEVWEVVRYRFDCTPHTARVTLAAALSAWPGVCRNGFLMNEVGQSLPAIILPFAEGDGQ